MWITEIVSIFASINHYDNFIIEKRGYELDGMPIDCGRLERMADNGGVGADVFKGGRFVHHEPLTEIHRNLAIARIFNIMLSAI